MAFQVSPGVNVSEIDLTTIVPAVATTEGAIAGVFQWGPVDKRVLVDTETTLAARFGKPSTFNAETWFTAASFLGYGNKLYVTRAANTTANSTQANSSLAAFNAVATVSGNSVSTTGNSTVAVPLLQCVVRNDDEYDTVSATFPSDAYFIARYPGAVGNSLRISVCDSASAYTSNVTIIANSTGINTTSSNSTLSFSVNSNTASMTYYYAGAGDANTSNAAAYSFANSIASGDYLVAGNTTIGTQYLKIVNTTVNAVTNSTGGTIGHRTTINFYDKYQLSTDYSSNSTVQRYWEFFNNVTRAPGTSDYTFNFGNSSAVDEIHAIVVDQDGKFTGVPGTILERYESLSRATDAKSQDGTNIFISNVINDSSQYIWAANSSIAGGAYANALAITSSTTTLPRTRNFNQGSDGPDETGVSLSDVTRAYNLYASAEDVDISFVLTGKTSGFTLPNWLIDNIAETRKDCMVFISPQKNHVVNNLNNEKDSIVSFRNNLRSTSYAVLDSGYKYMYDRYNDLYRWVPLNGDIAGLCVRADNDRDPWFSPAGFNRGQLKNLVKLAYNPRKAERDILYQSGVNPVVSFPGQGTVLFGDKTLLAKPSAFDRINVRRLFIVLEKAISTSAKFTLFEFNDAFTRAQFTSLVNPFLRDVKGRRGIYDFLVVCDETNNTPERIDRNEFWGDIYIKPARSINFIQLNFVAVRTGVQFSEVVGQF